MNKNLLIELGTEELPPKSLDELSQAFADGIAAGLAKRGVAFYESGVMKLNSPRRLAVLIEDVALTQPEQKLERRGPAINAGIGADGQPSKALVGFAADTLRRGDAALAPERRRREAVRAVLHLALALPEVMVA